MTEPAGQQSTTSLSWRVRVCRWLLGALLFFWGMVVVNIFTSTIANLNTTTTGTPLANLFIVHLALTYPFPVWSSLGLLLALTLLSWFGSQEHPAVTPLSPSQQNRLHLLHRLRFIYDQLMTDSLQIAAWLELGVGLQTGCCAQRESIAPPYPNPAGASAACWHFHCRGL